MGVTKKIVDNALAGLKSPVAQRRNNSGQFHGPLTTVPQQAPTDVPEISFTGWAADPEPLLDEDLPGQAAIDDGCEDGLGDF